MSDETRRDPSSSEGTSDEADPSVTFSNGDLGSDAKFFIVGVGASAGGLEALNQLLKRLVHDTMAIVVVQHLAPTHESVLPALLARASNTKVLAVEDGMRVEPNRVYVIPPNADLAILQGVLHLMTPGVRPTEHAVRLPIDYFFRSLAQDQGPRSIGIVLSGTGTDGTFGLRAIKEAGGITFAQDPTSAKYDGMPRSAFDSGWADFCLKPEEIADELLNISRHPYLAKARIPPQQFQENIGKLVVLIRTAFHNDLGQYKPTTIDRRIERRMALHKVERFDDYLKFVESNEEELRLLYKDMLIGVTAFFRDHDPFDAVKTKVFPRLMEKKQPGAHIRLWVPACSTGEEPYSYAMCLLEYLGEKAQDYRIQIFGTDVDEASIQRARRGIYPQNIALDVSPERLHHFFVKGDDGYQISRRVRDMVVFSVQNVIKDAPFSRLDLASCRNLLIYLQPAVQKKVLRMFHYALNPDGILVLGTSETVGDSSEIFSLVDRKNKIYAKKHVASAAAVDFGFGSSPHERFASLPAGVIHRPPVDLASIADRKILELYAPAGVVINGEMEILHIRGRTGPYLEPMPGTPSFNILRLARPELHVDLRRAIHEAQTSRARVTVDSRLHDAGALRPVKIEVVPINYPEAKGPCWLVLFHDVATQAGPRQASPALPADSADGGSASDQHLHELERELVVVKQYLQSTVEELESGSEELKSSNEELQSSNEELQSTNEELETSKEELQSSNEELTTVNDELHDRMTELQQANDDLHNVLTGIGNAVVIIGMDLRIRRYTHTAERLLNLVPGDIGRSVTQLNAFVVGQRVEDVAALVIQKLTPVETEVLCADQRWYVLHVSPYRTMDHQIKGAVVVLIDADVRKRATELGVAGYAQSFLGALRQPLAIVDQSSKVLWVNEPFLSAFHLTVDEAIGRGLSRLGAGEWSDGDLSRRLASSIGSGVAFKDVRVRVARPNNAERIFAVSGNRIPSIAEQTILILLSFIEDGAPPAPGNSGEKAR